MGLTRDLARNWWRGRRVFVTGHTGFKGAWLTAWLASMEARVTGYALAPPTNPNLFTAASLADRITSIEGDVRDLAALRDALRASDPEVVFHLAAQSLVRPSYDDPVATYATNVMGTVNLLEAVRGSGARAVIVVTSDKCYDNREWVWPYRENDPLGGHDPYSSSKAAAELVAHAYRFSFFDDDKCGIATVRAGNVIGGGDWAAERLVPDLLRAFASGQPAAIRNPGATRPWQFVLEPLRGYLDLARLIAEGGAGLAGAWNFGPLDHDVRPVHWIADRLVELWGGDASWRAEPEAATKPEAFTLKLDSAKARTLLGWTPKVDLATALGWIVEFHRGWLDDPTFSAALMRDQLEQFEAMHA